MVPSLLYFQQGYPAACRHVIVRLVVPLSFRCLVGVASPEECWFLTVFVAVSCVLDAAVAAQLNSHDLVCLVLVTAKPSVCLGGLLSQ